MNILYCIVGCIRAKALGWIVKMFFFSIFIVGPEKRCRLVRKKSCKKLKFVEEKFDQRIAPEGFGRNSIGIFGDIRVKALILN